MKQHSISFIVPMVRATLAGKKTVTRRKGMSVTAKRMEVGDQLWVKEHFRLERRFDGDTGLKAAAGGSKVLYGTDEAPPEFGVLRIPRGMARVYSRITLEIVDKRLERLQDITGEDAIAEGIELAENGKGWRDYHDADNSFRDPRESYRSLWEMLNRGYPGDYSWIDNPSVFRIEFKLISHGRAKA